MKTVILGNGILAVTTAFRLAKKCAASDEIVVIGKKVRPGSATLAAAAMLNSFAEIEEGSLDSEIDRYRFELSHLATRMWPKFILDVLEQSSSHLPEGCKKCEGPCGGCFALGTYLVNNTGADDLDAINFNAVIAALKEFDEPYSDVSPDSIPNYFPEERYRATRAIHIPNEGWLNPRLTLDVFDAALGSFKNVKVIDGEVAEISHRSNLISGVTLADGTKIQGDQYLLATGATSTDLLQKSNISLDIPRIFYGVGVSIELKSPEYPHKKCIRTPNRGLACGLYSVPFFIGPEVPHDSIIIGASNFISPVPVEHGRALSIEGLLRGAMEQINRNFYKATVTRVNVGWRPTTADTYPVIGPTSIKNLIVATGTKRDGFHLSPVLSEILTSILTGRSIDPRFDVFKPERKLIRTLSRQEAVSKGAKHLISAAYQHGFVPPHGKMTSQIAQLYRDELEKLHDQVGAHDWGIPPEMLDMYRYGHIKG
jgi:glycine/D-amino acid oxidase-like deaminating enzyme